jgi:O-antigen/teichoic acid export membrane protein
VAAEDTLATAHQIISALKWNAIGRLSAQLVSWAITLVVMRLLVPADYGLMSLAVMMTGFFALFNRLGAVPGLIQKREIDAILIRKVYGLLLLSNCILYIIIFVGAPYFAAFFNQPQLAEIVRILGVLLLLDSLAAIPSALLQRDLKFKSISLIELSSTIIGSLSVLALALSGFGVWALVTGSLVKPTINTILLLKFTRFRMLPQFNFTGLGSVLSFGTKVSAAQIVWYISSNFDVFLVGRVLGKEMLGIYSVAYNLALMPTNKIMSLSNQIAFAAYSRIQDEHTKVIKYFQESVALAALMFFPVSWGMSAIADDLVAVVLGPKWQQGAVVLRIIALGIPYRAFALLMDPLVTGLGESGLSLRNTLTTVFIISIAMVIGVQWELTGLCIGWLIGGVMAATINLNRNLRLLGMVYTQLLTIVFPSMLSAGLMYMAVLLAHGGPLESVSAALRLPLEIAFGAVVYGGLMLIFNRPVLVRSFGIIRAAI